MIIHSDWHIHCEASYDSTLPLDEIAAAAETYGFTKMGITDHVNYNDERFFSCLRESSRIVGEFQKTHPNFVLGVELTPISQPMYDHIKIHGTRDGFVAPESPVPYPINLACTKDELTALGVRYAIGASHWRVDRAGASGMPVDIDASIREWYRQQMWLACDERVTILGHPWYHGKCIWYDDFSRIPHSMNTDIGAALKEHGKYVECAGFFFSSPGASEKFKHQYAEFIRELFEMGVPVTYSSDAHNTYKDKHTDAEPYLVKAGFKDGDIGEIAEKDLW